MHKPSSLVHLFRKEEKYWSPPLYQSKKIKNDEKNVKSVIQQHRMSKSYSQDLHEKNDDHQQLQTRRQILHNTAATATTAGAFLLSSQIITHPTENANAAPDVALLSTQSKKFSRVPCFAIVKGSTGVPFMILQNTGKAQAYFFTSYDGAQSVLDDAKRDAAEKDVDTKQMWDDARLSAVNMEFVLKLSSGKTKATAQNNASYDAVYDVIPSTGAISAAEKIDKSGMYSERGRLPLFYSDEFQIGPEKEGGSNRIPVFLEKADLLREFSKKYPEKTDVVVTVVDLMDTFAVMMGNKPIGAKVDEEIVNKFYVVPSLESRKKAVDCEKERGSVPAYQVGQMIAVGGK